MDVKGESQIDEANRSAGEPAGPGRVLFIATCTFGLESVVARELAGLGFDARATTTGRVEWSVPVEDWPLAAVRSNLWLRSADRVLICVGRFAAPDFDALFEQAKALGWSAWIPLGAAFPVAGRCVRSRLSSEPAVQRATKRAIVESLRKSHGLGPNAMVPEADAASPGTVRVEVSILRDQATLTIDTSGIGLHKRGYREGVPGEAAMKETLAAGLVQLSVWDGARATRQGRAPRALMDPFCGSGTIAIEAAMLARNIAPGLHRSFDCERWGAYGPGQLAPRLSGPERGGPMIDPAIWERERGAARSAVRTGFALRIAASDVDEQALRLARTNARRAGVEGDIQFSRRDVREIASPDEYGVIVTNPPYGVRLGADGSLQRTGERRDARPSGFRGRPALPNEPPEVRVRDRRLLPQADQPEVEALYRAMPLAFRRLPTWSFHVFTGRLDLEQIFGQEATRRRKIYNSKIECCLFSFLGPRPSESGAAGEGASGEVHSDRGAVPMGVIEEHTNTVDRDDRCEPGTEPGIEPETSARGPDSHAAFGGLRERDEKEAREFGACLGNNLRHLRKYPARGVTCYRVYERDVPDVPLIIDKYEDCFHVAEYERRHSRTPAQQADWFERMRRVIVEVSEVPPERVFIKEKHRQRGLTQHEKVGQTGHAIVVREGGLKFEVNLADYIDTGLFLDHRLTREMVREECARFRERTGRGARMLNLFCYTGSFSVYAASAGASTTSVDLSNTYLDWAQRNFRLNGLGAGHRFLRSDVVEFLSRNPGGPYELAVVDPPTFSNSKSTEEDWEVLTGHARVLESLAPAMAPGGVVYFSTNFRRFKLNTDAVTRAGYSFREITSRTIPPEYRNRRIHACWRLVRAD